MEVMENQLQLQQLIRLRRPQLILHLLRRVLPLPPVLQVPLQDLQVLQVLQVLQDPLDLQVMVIDVLFEW